MTFTTTQSHDDRLGELLVRGKQYEFLQAADTLLQKEPLDHELRLRTVQELLSLRLVDPAKELLDHLPEGQQLNQLRQQINEIPSYIVPWDKRRPQLQKNICALTEKGIDVSNICEQWSRRCDTFRLFVDSNGVDQIQQRSADGSWQWLSMVNDHQAAAKAIKLPENIETLFPGPYLFDGIGLGWLLQRIYDKTYKSFLTYSCALYVVEPNPEILALALHLHDWADLLRDERVFVFTGPKSIAQFRQNLVHDESLPLPTHILRCSICSSDASPVLFDEVNAVSANRSQCIQKSFEDLERRYSTRDLFHWSQRFRSGLTKQGKPLRILAAVSMHTTFLQYSMRDIKSALESLGHQCTVLMESRPFESISPLVYHQAIRKMDADLFLSIDHLRGSFANVLPKNLPLLSWDQDQLPHVFTRENISRVEPHDFIAGCSKNQFVRLGGDFDQFVSTWMPASEYEFERVTMTHAEAEHYHCDVSYVSHASQTPKAFHEQERNQCSDVIHKKLLDALYEQMPDLLARYQVPSGLACSVLLDATLQDMGVELRDVQLREHLLTWYMWRLGDRMFRHESLSWVARWSQATDRSFRIYGNGWENHPTLAPYAAGPAQNGRELNCIYRATRINLQLMPAGFIHPRALDGLLSGGFLLTRLVPLDQRGGMLRALVRRMDDLQIHSTVALKACSDSSLKALLSGYHGATWPGSDACMADYERCLRAAAELRYPDEIFTNYSNIVFDSEEAFIDRANHYLSDVEDRENQANAMRSIVVKELGYRNLMSKLLGRMSLFLSQQVER